MVATVSSVTGPLNRAAVGQGFDGVVRVSTGVGFGSGVLLYDGRAVLTAAHLFERLGSGSSVAFETVAGVQMRAVSEVAIHPGYDPSALSHDLAIAWLADTAPTGANRYPLYRDVDEFGSPFTFVGYGLPGTGALGWQTDQRVAGERLKAANRFEATSEALEDALGGAQGQQGSNDSQLVADFDNGRPQNDALGQLAGINGLGLGVSEGLLTPGDSGSPAFIAGAVAGIGSYTVRVTANDGLSPDIDGLLNSTFGELAGWQRVSSHQQWVDQSLRARLPGAPAGPEDVVQRIAETDQGTSYAYFLVSFNGTRGDAGEILSVDYATRDGTAIAGVDYLAVEGTLNLYPGEDQAVIPVEIIGDRIPEPDEVFYLDAFNPIGGGFPEGAVQLTAQRTIVDNDGVA
jgi:hypothetical protein